MHRAVQLEYRFAKCLAGFREARRRNPRVRPFAVEFYGIPRAFKTTCANGVENFLNREGWKVVAPPEGPEMVKAPYGRIPLYNYRTFWYAMCQAYDHRESLFEAVIVERGNFDHAAWLEYWARKGELSRAEQKVCEAYALQPRLREQFDLHVCFLADPAVALGRGVATTVSPKEGETKNKATMELLHEINRGLWERFHKDDPERMPLVDTTNLVPVDATFACLEHICAAFERRLKTL